MDTIANLVGILIIFVVIVVCRSKEGAIQAAHEELQAKAKETLAEPVRKTEDLMRDVERHAKQYEQYAIEVEYRKAERNAMLDQVTLAKQAIEEKLSELDSSSRESFEANQELSELQQKLAQLLQQKGDVENSKSEAIVLQHLPTPMAKTVFNKEVHLMLRNGKVTVIPWDRLIESLKQQVELAVRRNSRKELIEDRLGPIGGFVMNYRLISKRGMISNGGSSTAMGQVVSLDRFELEPTNEMVQETLEQAMADGGRLRVELAGRNPRETVTTIWVYPDSFSQFRSLKEQLFTQGFMSAARPLPEGIRIGAAPSGSHSVAQ